MTNDPIKDVAVAMMAAFELLQAAEADRVEMKRENERLREALRTVSQDGDAKSAKVAIDALGITV